MTSRLNQTMCHIVAAVALGASLAARSAEIQQAGPSPQERVAALKQAMHAAANQLRRLTVASYLDQAEDDAIGTVLNLYF